MGKFCSKNLDMFLQTRIVGMFKMQDEHNLGLRQACIGPGKTTAQSTPRLPVPSELPLCVISVSE